METNFKITVPEPCHEDWNKMTPDQTGRFCSSCVKSVVDFTNMNTSEIQEYFIKNQGQKVCGRFKNEQLDSIIIQIPRDVLFSQVQFHKVFMLALLISMGTTLFSCQNSNGDKQKIDGVEVVDSVKEVRTMGVPLPEKVIEEEHLTGDTVYTSDKTKEATKTVSAKQNKAVTITSGIVAVEPHIQNRDTAIKRGFYLSNELDKLPEFPGGLKKFNDYFNSNFDISYDNDDIAKPFIVSFVIDVDGSLTDIKFLRGINKEMNTEATRILKSCPKWIPGERNGEKVRAFYSLPIKIKPE